MNYPDYGLMMNITLWLANLLFALLIIAWR